MNELLLNEARLIYKLLEKYPNIFKSSPKDLVDKLEQLKKGLPLENEFIALLYWMENCNIVHKLDQDLLSKEYSSKYQIPDLYASINYKGKAISVLIEVKTTEKKTTLKFSGKYYKRIMSYSKLTGLPLLIAWKIKNIGIWFLVDINEFKLKNKAWHLKFEEAIKNNLLGILLGEFSINFHSNIKMRIKFRKDKLISEKSGKQHKFETWKMTVVDFGFINYKGIKITSVNSLFFYILGLVPLTEKTLSKDNYIIQVWEIPENALIFASNLFSLALLGNNFEKYDPSSIDWNRIIRESNFYFSFHALKNVVNKALKDGLIQFIGKLLPVNKPKFINEIDKEKERA